MRVLAKAEQPRLGRRQRQAREGPQHGDSLCHPPGCVRCGCRRWGLAYAKEGRGTRDSGAPQDIANHYPDVETIHMVLDNLSTHSCRALEIRYGVRAGRRLWRCFTVHFTPVHGSWLNHAEVEITLLSRQCLGSRRIPTLDKLAQETDAWERWASHQRLRIR
ncbi:transposase [Myxococcus sp. NMCA1]|uniref:transposase n=1 Tax=Myxococcus sp. NMCA1 TaxID=2996785 RepID=UPI003FA5F8F9